LLRILQEREFERVGGVKTIKVDVRILAATNKDLEKVTKEGKFREDLFYRLNVIPLHLPPLRQRAEDITLLTAHFIQEFSQKRKREEFTFSSDAMHCLLKYHWPGNVRELENLIERLTILVSNKVVTVADLPEKFQQLIVTGMERTGDALPQSDQAAPTPRSVSLKPGEGEFEDSGIDLNKTVSGLERSLIMQALEKANGVRSKAAQLLKLNRTTLLEKMKKMGIDAKR
jgi:DNA-binding NtrC family response regulator